MPAHDGSMHRLPPYLVELCRTMRREPTEPEAWLWACLRGRRLAGAKFRRQRPLGRYIADFCCDEAKLVVELDGGVHASQDEYDSLRDEHLAAAGYRVLRIRNQELAANPEGVLATIMAAVDWGRDRTIETNSSSPLEWGSPSRGERKTNCRASNSTHGVPSPLEGEG